MLKVTVTDGQAPGPVLVKLSELRAHPDTVHPAGPESVYRLGRSLAHFGLLRCPIVLNRRTGTLLDGDKLLAALKACLPPHEEVWVWSVDVPEEEEDAAHAALNNHAGEWVWERVSELLRAVQAKGQDLALTGFHEYDIGPLVAAEWRKPEVGPLDGSDPKQGALL
jgi:hypothetical protein